MIRTVLTFAAGFVVAKFVMERGSVKRFAEVAREKAAKVKSSTRKAAVAAREEWCKKEATEEVVEAP